MNVPNDPPVPDPTVTETAQELLIRAGDMTVSVDKETTRLAFAADQGAIMLREDVPATFGKPGAAGWASLGRVQRWRVDADAVVVSVAFAAGLPGEAELRISFPLARSCQVRVKPGSAEQFASARVQFASARDEHFFGTGERFSTVDQRGKRFVSWAEDFGTQQSPGHPWTYWPVPFFMSNRGYGVVLHTTCRSDFDLCATSPTIYTISVNDTSLSYELFFGPHPLTILDHYTRRAGRPLMPPRWNNGIWRTALGGAEAVLREARRIRAAGIPCSALWVYDAHDPRGNIGWPINTMHHSGHYADVRSFVNQLHQLGFKVQTYVFPYYYQDSLLYAEADEQGYFLKNQDGSTYRWPFFSAVGQQAIRRPASIVDFTNPAAVAWWQAQLRYVLMDLGFDGWMHDFAEQVPEDCICYDGRSGRELHNEYPVLYQHAAQEACQRYKPDASFYARSGYTGSQAWLTAAWTGDQVCTWAVDVGLTSAIVACLSLGLTGVPYVGPDIGGYFGLDTPWAADSYSKELWLRWTQFGALCPIMRDHLGSKPAGSIELWTDDDTVACFAKFARLHMALSPYLLSCAHEATRTGAPIMRHMFLERPDDPATWGCDTQYLLGDALLVAPVLEDAGRRRRVYFPAGQWISFWDGTVYAGGAEVDVP
ncbi:MAG: TIM-barrel domain-containing protein, partial [Roseiflexaceae bacterium]